MDKFGGASAKLKHAFLCIRFAQILDKFGGASVIEASFMTFGLHKFLENRIFTDANDYSMEIELGA